MSGLQALRDAGFKVEPTEAFGYLVVSKNLNDVENVLTKAGFTKGGGYKSSTGESRGFYSKQGKHVTISQPKSKKYFKGTFVDGV